MIKPILFSTDMVRAILGNRKTVMRRAVKPQPTIYGFLETHFSWDSIKATYRPGDILYVRETWCDPSDTGYPILYKADMPMHWDAEDTECGVPVDLKAEDYKWHPSIHMPREAARIFLRVTNVRVERLQDITEDQAINEGAEREYIDADVNVSLSAKNAFANIWNSTIKPADRSLYGWEANPWVFVISFERISNNEALQESII